MENQLNATRAHLKEAREKLNQLSSEENERKKNKYEYLTHVLLILVANLYSFVHEHQPKTKLVGRRCKKLNN